MTEQTTTERPINAPAEEPTPAGNSITGAPAAEPVTKGDKGKHSAEQSSPGTSCETQAQPEVAKPIVLEGRIEHIAVDQLKRHPLSVATYGEEITPDLEKSVRENGIREPLLVTTENIVVSGNSRLTAGVRAGLKSVPVIRFGSGDPLDIEAAVLETNKQRIKNEEQKAREYDAWKRIETKRAHFRMGKKDEAGAPVQNFAPDEMGTARDKAAVKVGNSAPTLEKSSKVVAVIDKLIGKNKTKKAEELRTLLNEKSVDAAFKLAKAQGHIITPGGRKPGKLKKNAAATGEMANVPAVPDTIDPERDAAHDAAFERADEVITFFRSKHSGKLTVQQRKDWAKLLGQLTECLDKVGLKPA